MWGLWEEDDTKIKSIINQMKDENWDAACLQETWRQLGTDDIYINDYHIFFQDNSVKINTRGRVMGGVCIILSPTFDWAHKKNGREITNLETGKIFKGRIIGEPLTFPNVDNSRKKFKGTGHHTMLNIPTSQQHRIQKLQHNPELNTNKLSPETNIILGHSINTNVGTSAHSEQHLKEMIGAYGTENRNKKGT